MLYIVANVAIVFLHVCRNGYLMWEWENATKHFKFMTEQPGWSVHVFAGLGTF